MLQLQKAHPNNMTNNYNNYNQNNNPHGYGRNDYMNNNLMNSNINQVDQMVITIFNYLGIRNYERNVKKRTWEN